VSPESTAIDSSVDAELVGDDLRERGPHALPLVGDAGEHGDGARRLEAHRRPLLSGDRRAPDAVELRARARQLDEAREPDAHRAARRARGPLLAPERVVPRGLEQRLERGVVAAAVVDVPRGGGVRELVGAHEVASPELRRVEPEIARDQLDHALGHGGRDRMPDGAVLGGDHLVLGDHLERRVVVAKPVRAWQEAEDLAALDDARARVRRVRTDGRRDVGAHPGQRPIGGRRDLHAHRLLAGVDVGEKRLAARRHPLDGAAEHLRQGARRQVVLVDVDLDAEAPAHVGRDDAHPLLGQ